MLAHENLYAVLNLQPSASASEIRSAYRHAALHAHPDKGGSVAAFHSITLAYEVLSCMASKELYNKHLKHECAFREDAPRKKKRVVPSASVPAPKRAKSEDAIDEQHSKDAEVPMTQESHIASCAMNRLHIAMQDLPATHRKAAISRMPLSLRRELLVYMSNEKASAPCSKLPKVKLPLARRVRGQDSFTRGTDIRTLKFVHKTAYQVQLRIRHMRMYTKAQDSIDTAIQHQIALVEVRHALISSGELIWDCPQKFANIITSNLRKFGTCIEDLGFSVFISMKADDYICRPATISSPVLTLTEAVAVHSRLLKARKTSWDNLRAEWIPLMYQTQRSRVRKLSLAKVETIVDTAHLKLLHRHFRQAVIACERALKLRQKVNIRAAKLQAKAERLAQKAKARSMRKQGNRTRHEWAAYRRRFRADLTMDEIMQGFPQHV
jgi:curved DNA-binding protein CbpA